jgi:hypothetical protein
MRRHLVVLSAIGFVGCSSDTAPSLSVFAGDYALTSIDGVPLPAKRADGQTVTVGDFLMNANGAFQFTETTTQNGSTIESADGVCTAKSATTMSCQASAPGADAFTGTVSDKTLSLTTSDGVKLYTKCAAAFCGGSEPAGDR